MIIHYITNARIPTEKAHGYQIAKMCEAFGRLNHKVTLVIPSRINSKDLKNTDPYQYYDTAKNFGIKKLLIPDLIWLTAKLPGKIQYLVLLVYSFSFALSAMLYCIVNKPELIITRDNRVAYFLSFFNKVIYESHLFSRNKVERFFEKSAFKRCICFITITQNLKKVYESYGFKSEKILVLPDGVDVDKFNISVSKEEARMKTGLPKHYKIVGYLGRFRIMDAEKGLKDLIRSMKYIEAEDVRLMVIGGPVELIETYFKIIQDENLLSEKYIFKDTIPHSEVPMYLKSFDCCVLTLPWKEAFAVFMSPLKMFEYMASGCPIIAPDLPNVREILNDDMCVFVAPDDMKGIASAIEKVLSDQDLATKISFNAMQEANKYSWVKRADMLINHVRIMH